MSSLRWERTGRRLARPFTEGALRRELGRLPNDRNEWVGIFRPTSMLYLARMGHTFDVVFQDEVDATWRVWVTEPQPDEAGLRPDLDLSVAWAMDFVARGLVGGVLRDSEEDAIRARGLKALLRAEVAVAIERGPSTPPRAVQLHLHRQRAEAAVSLLVGDWSSESRTVLPDTTRQLELLARDAPWCVGDELTRVGFDVLRRLTDVLPAGVLGVLALDDLPIEHSIAAAELLHGVDAAAPWRRAVSHDTARLWSYRGDLKKFGRSQQAAEEPSEAEDRGPSQTGFDFG